jgi:hypothetical protein
VRDLELVVGEEVAMRQSLHDLRQLLDPVKAQNELDGADTRIAEAHELLAAATQRLRDLLAAHLQLPRSLFGDMAPWIAAFEASEGLDHAHGDVSFEGHRTERRLSDPGILWEPDPLASALGHNDDDDDEIDENEQEDGDDDARVAPPPLRRGSVAAPLRSILKNAARDASISESAEIAPAAKRVLLCLPGSGNGGLLLFFQPGRNEVLSPALLPVFRAHAALGDASPPDEQWWQDANVPCREWPSPTMYAVPCPPQRLGPLTAIT